MLTLAAGASDVLAVTLLVVEAVGPSKQPWLQIQGHDVLDEQLHNIQLTPSVILELLGFLSQHFLD